MYRITPGCALCSGSFGCAQVGQPRDEGLDYSNCDESYTIGSRTVYKSQR